VRNKPGTPIRVLDTPCYPLGFLPNWPATLGDPIHIEPGGGLLVATDGIYEAFDPQGEQFGSERVIHLLDEAKAKTAADALAAIRRDVDKWQGNEEPHDDQTAIVVRRRLS
jgi:sigma-B regulation protein RsbU (phosphoserine phosphatase)